MKDTLKELEPKLKEAGYISVGIAGYPNKNASIDLWVEPARLDSEKGTKDTPPSKTFAALSIVEEAGIKHEGVNIFNDRLIIRRIRPPESPTGQTSQTSPTTKNKEPETKTKKS